MNFSIKEITQESPLFNTYKKIRRDVFVTEQEVDEELEWEFEDEAIHFLAFWNDEPAGTARYRKTEKGIKLERFAVVKNLRNKGIAARILNHMLALVKPQSDYIYLHAQDHAIGFYKKYGFKSVGEPFEEATIMHEKMVYGFEGCEV